MTDNRFQNNHHNFNYNYTKYSLNRYDLSKQNLKKNQPKNNLRNSLIFGALTFILLISSFFTGKQNFFTDYKTLNYTKFILIGLSFSSAIISTHYLIQLNSLEDYTEFLQTINFEQRQNLLEKNQIMLFGQNRKTIQPNNIKPSTSIVKREISSPHHNFSRIYNPDL